MIHCLKITIPNKYLISLLTEIDSGAKREYVIGRILRISDIDHIRRRCLTTLFILSQSPFFCTDNHSHAHLHINTSYCRQQLLDCIISSGG